MTVTIHPYVGNDDNGGNDGWFSHSTHLLEFETRAAPFGVEWAEPVTAQVVIPDGSSFLCEETTTELSNSVNVQAQHKEYPLAYLVEEGDCSWEEKALNVHGIGGDYMILYSSSGTMGLPSGHPSITTALWDAPEIDPPIGALGITRDSGLNIREKVLQARAASANNGTSSVGLLATIKEDYTNAFANPLNVEAHVTAMQVSAMLSFLGSAWIVSRLLQKKKRSESKTPTLFLLFLSLGDCISSLCLFVGPWAIPQVPAKFGQLSTEIWHTYFPLASGTHATCAAQGFFYHFSAFVGGCCTSFLAVQNLLIVKHNWSNERIHKLERPSLIGSIVLSLGMSIACAAMDVFNPIPYGFCWIAQFPMMCESIPGGDDGGILGSWCAQDSTSTNDNLARFFFALIWMSAFFVTICSCMALIYCYVRKQERTVERWSENAREGRAQKHVLWKAMCYLAAFLMVHGVGGIGMFLGAPWVKFLMALVYPLQGLFNALIYSNALDRLFGCQPRRSATSTPPSSSNVHGRGSSSDVRPSTGASIDLSPHSLAWYRRLRRGVSTMVSTRSVNAGNHDNADTTTAVAAASAAAEDQAKKEEEVPEKKKKKSKSKTKKKKEKKTENKLKAEFKLWKSLPSTFETWTSEATPYGGRKRNGFRLWSAPPSDYETWKSGAEPLAEPSKSHPKATTVTAQMDAMEGGLGIGAIKTTDQSQTVNSLDTAIAAVCAADEQLGQEEPSSDDEEESSSNGEEEEEEEDNDGLAQLAALTRGLSIPHCIENDSLHFSDPSENEQQEDRCCVVDKPQSASDSGESTQEHNGDSKACEGPCVSCGKTIQTVWKFCPHCGSSRDCSSCGKQLQPEWTFCPHCGKGR